jgi:hypothetical protein
MGSGWGKEMFTIALRISGVLGVWQEVVVGGGASPQLRAIPRLEELILQGSSAEELEKSSVTSPDMYFARNNK